MYGSWDVERDGQNVLSFSTPLKKRKFKILNKMKKSLDISFYINVQKKSWSYAALFLRYDAWRM